MTPSWLRLRPRSVLKKAAGDTSLLSLVEVTAEASPHPSSIILWLSRPSPSTARARAPAGLDATAEPAFGGDSSAAAGAGGPTFCGAEASCAVAGKAINTPRPAPMSASETPFFISIPPRERPGSTGRVRPCVFKSSESDRDHRCGAVGDHLRDLWRTIFPDQQHRALGRIALVPDIGRPAADIT